ncbi:MAG: lipid-transfer protein [Dehalococcoidia bacterium]|nr:lipid-transfer protein [Dehalococcoidia bacterium]
MNNIKNRAAIVGISMTKFSKDSERTELYLTCQCIKAALDDAGLTPDDVDGLVKQTDDASDEHAVTSSMGMGNLTYFGESRWGAAPSAMAMRAAMGVATGVANYIVVYRSVNGASKRRMTPSMRTSGQMSTSDLLQWTFHAPFGHMSNAGRVAMIVRRYMHEFGINNDQFGWVPTVCREHGARNANSMFYQKPITFEDYLKSKMIVEPLRRMDFYEEADAAAALVVTTPERAKDLKQRPVYVLGAAQHMALETEELTSYYRPSISGLPEMGKVGEKIFAMAGVTPKDIKCVQLDDSYGPFVPMQLEELGFCNQGEGVDFCNRGDRIRLGGELPLNTSGGSLGEGHIHGMNHVIEAVRQIRGTSTAQVKDAELVLVASGAGGPASGLILGGKS